MNRRFTLRDVLAAHEQHQHVIDAVAMHSLRGRQAALAPPRLDPELMHFHVPRRAKRRQLAEEPVAEPEDCRQRFAGADVRLHRFEPARDAAVERVVLATLKMWLARFAYDRVAAGRVGGVPASSVPSAVRHVGVERKIVPARGEAVEVGERQKVGEQAPHDRTAHEDEAIRCKRLLQ